MFGLELSHRTKIINIQKDKHHVLYYMYNLNFRKHEGRKELVYVWWGTQREGRWGQGSVNKGSICSKYKVHMYECHGEIHYFVQILYTKEINLATVLVNKNIEKKIKKDIHAQMCTHMQVHIPRHSHAYRWACINTDTDAKNHLWENPILVLGTLKNQQMWDFFFRLLLNVIKKIEICKNKCRMRTC